MKHSKINTAYILKIISTIVLATFGIIVFIFALLSGSEAYGGGLLGIVKNSPNAIPWAILLILVYIAWKWKLVGGILITVFGIASLWFFGSFTGQFQVVTFIIGLIPISMGGLLILSWILDYQKLSKPRL